MVFGGLKKKVKKKVKAIKKSRKEAKKFKKEIEKIEQEAYREALREEAAIQAKARGKAKAAKKAKGGSSLQEKLNTVAKGFKKVQKKAAELERSGFGKVNLFQTGGFGTADLLGMSDFNKKKKKKKKSKKGIF